MFMEELLNHIKNFLECPLVSVFASVLSIIAAILTFFQYKNTREIKEELGIEESGLPLIFTLSIQFPPPA